MSCLPRWRMPSAAKRLVGLPHQLCIASIPVTDRHTSVAMESTTEQLGQLSQRAWLGLASLRRTGLRSAHRSLAPVRQTLRQSLLGFCSTNTKRWRTRCGLRKQLRPKKASADGSGMVQLARDKVKLKSVQAQEAAAQAEIPRARALAVARVTANVQAHDVVSSASSGMTAAAENTTDQADRKTEIPKLAPGENEIDVHGVSREDVRLCHGDPPPEAEPSTDRLSSVCNTRHVLDLFCTCLSDPQTAYR